MSVCRHCYRDHEFTEGKCNPPGLKAPTIPVSGSPTGRPRVHASAAAKQKAYRQRKAGAR